MSCISELGCHMDSPDTWQEELKDCHIDNHGQFISQPAIWQPTADMQKKTPLQT